MRIKNGFFVVSLIFSIFSGDVCSGAAPGSSANFYVTNTNSSGAGSYAQAVADLHAADYETNNIVFTSGARGTITIPSLKFEKNYINFVNNSGGNIILYQNADSLGSPNRVTEPDDGLAGINYGRDISFDLRDTGASFIYAVGSENSDVNIHGGFYSDLRVVNTSRSARGIYSGNDLSIDGGINADFHISSVTGNNRLIFGYKVLIDGDVRGNWTGISRDERSFGVYAAEEFLINGEVAVNMDLISESRYAYGFYCRADTHSDPYGIRFTGPLSGNINVTSALDDAVAIYAEKGTIDGGNADTPLHITGNVLAKGKTGAYGVLVLDKINLNLSGKIEAIDTSGGGNAYAIKSGDTSGNTRDVNDRVVIDGGTLIGKIDLGGGANTLIVEDSGNLTGDVNNITDLIKNGKGTCNTSGQINTKNLIVNNGRFVADAPTPHQITGNLATAPGGQFTLIVRPATTPAAAVDTVTNNGNIHFQLGTLVPSGTSFQVLASSGLGGTGTYSSPLLTLTNDGSNIRATKKKYTEATLYSDNARTMAALLNPYTSTATGDMLDLMTKIDKAPTVDAFNTCLEELLAHTDLPTMGMETARQFSLSTQTRMSGLRAQGQANRTAKTVLNPDDPDSWPLLASAGDMAGLFDRQPDEKPHGVFLKTLNQKGTRDSEIGYTGYDHDTTGITGGIDRVFNNAFLAGISLGYAKNDVDYKDAGHSHTNVSNLGTGIYASIFHGEWYIDAIISGTRNTSHANRNISFLNAVAQSDQEGYTLSGKIDGGYGFKFNEMGITPLLSLEYLYFNQNAYTETGAGPANLTVESLDGNSLKTGLGLKLDRTFRPSQWWSLTPEVSARWMHEFIDQNQDIQVAMSGIPGRIFSQETIGPKDDSIRIRAGLTSLYKTDFALLFHYLGEFEKDARSHGLTCEFQYLF